MKIYYFEISFFPKHANAKINMVVINITILSASTNTRNKLIPPIMEAIAITPISA